MGPDSMLWSPSSQTHPARPRVRAGADEASPGIGIMLSGPHPTPAELRMEGGGAQALHLPTTSPRGVGQTSVLGGEQGY